MTVNEVQRVLHGILQENMDLVLFHQSPFTATKTERSAILNINPKQCFFGSSSNTTKTKVIIQTASLVSSANLNHIRRINHMRIPCKMDVCTLEFSRRVLSRVFSGLPVQPNLPFTKNSFAPTIAPSRHFTHQKTSWAVERLTFSEAEFGNTCTRDVF